MKDVDFELLVERNKLKDAVKANDFEAIRDLMERSSSEVSSERLRRESELYHIAMRQATPDMRIVEHLLKAGVDVTDTDYTGQRPVDIAVEKELLLFFDCLSKYGVTACAARKGTALHAAVEKKNRAIIEYLITKGFDLYLENDGGMTPFDCAVNASDRDCLDFFLRQGYDINHRSSVGRTALFHSRSVDMVRYLEEHDADLLARENDGKNLLFTGVFRLRDYGLAPLEYLVERGLPVNQPDNKGLTVLQYLKERQVGVPFEIPTSPFGLTPPVPNEYFAQLMDAERFLKEHGAT